MLTIYKASAGSGKTYTLTKQYITYLLGEKETMPDGTAKWHAAHGRNRHRRILAITFTNKATAEMKERIVKQLSRLAGYGQPGDYIEHLTTTLGVTEPQLRELAQRALNDILFDYQNFNVSTIDSFFQQVLRSLAYELDHPGDFSVEIEETNVMNEGIRRLMSAFNGSSSRRTPFEVMLKKIMTDRRASGGSSNIFNRKSPMFGKIASYAGDLFDERFKLISEHVDPLLRDYELRRRMAERLEQLRDECSDRLKDLAAAIRSRFTDKQWANFNANVVRNPVAKFEQGIMLTPAQLKSNKSIPLWFKDELPVEKFVSKNAHKVLDDVEGTVRMLAADLRECFAICARHAAFEALIAELPAYEFMAQVQKFIDEYRLENGVVVLSDTNSILKQIMSFEEDVPFVYEKMAMRLEHFLIDEFQDTSRMQWDNLSPMVHNSVAFGNDNLIIGDEKQAIYRFRNSDSSMLHHDVAADARFADNVVIEGDKLEQNTNRRSAPEIVRFNNVLFKHLAEKLDVPGFENVVQGIAPNKETLPGYVLFQPYPAVDDDSAETPAEAALNLMVSNIVRQHYAGYAWSDIAVIANKNKECETVVRKLQASGVPVATDDALYLSSSPLLRMIVSAMQLIYNSASNKQVLTSTKGRQNLFKIHFEFEYARLLNAGMPSEEAMQEATEKLVRINESMPDQVTVSPAIRAVIDRQPSTIIELAETVLRECMLRAPHDSLTDLNSYDLTPGQKTYMAAFCDMICDYVDINGNDLGAFLKYWHDRSDSLTINGAYSSDMVSVMTIHKSKGLERPCVHIPFVEYKLEGGVREKPQWVTAADAPALPWSDPALPQAMLVSLSGMAAYQASPLYTAYKRNLTERITDGLNKSYVALTRPMRELCAYYDPDKDFGHELAEAFGTLFAGAGYDADTAVLELGAPTTPEKPEEEKKTPEGYKPDPEKPLIRPSRPSPFYAVAYNDAAEGVTHLASSAPGDPEPEVSADDDEEDPATVAMQLAADRGTRLHLVLSRVAHKGLLRNALSRFARLLSDDDTDTLRQMFDNPATAEYVERWFAPGTRAVSEATVYGGPDHDHPIKRIDRIVYRPDGTIEVIDFKFTTAEDPSHRAQVADYVHLISLANPGTPVRGYLWYADLHRVIRL